MFLFIFLFRLLIILNHVFILCVVIVWRQSPTTLLQPSAQPTLPVPQTRKPTKANQMTFFHQSKCPITFP